MKSWLLKTTATLFLIVWASPAVSAQPVDVDNVIIVLDASGSMRENMSNSTSRIKAAKQAIHEVVSNIPQSTQIGILAFGATREKWLFPLGPRNDQEMLNRVQRLQTGGGTPLGEYMKLGADRLMEARESQFGYGTFRLLIVTDGEASDQRVMEKYTPEIVARGIRTDVIGVDMKKTHSLKSMVHSYRRADDPAALKRALEEVFAEIGTGASGGSAEDVFAELEGFPGELALPMIQALGNTGNVPVGKSGIDYTPTKNFPDAPIDASPASASTQNQDVAIKTRGTSSRKLIIISVIAIFLIVKFVFRKRSH